MAETLFSLEVHVESVEELRVSCKLPALCFRLLDFPTMIIHHVSPLDAEKIRQRLRMDGRESLLYELKDRFGNFQFRKGKSCLFKASIDTLLVQLQTVPLYAMLMDLWPKKPTLVGSTLIPLKKAIDKISADVYEKGVAVPAFYRDEGDFSVYNLMGSSIAKVKLGFRLLSLGGSLIPHIPTESLGKRIGEKVETSEKVEQAVKSALQKVLPEIESGNATEKELSTEGKYNHGNVTAAQRTNIQHVEVQTSLRSIKQNSRALDRQRRNSEEDVVITNTFCPPPLYYNYFSNSTPHHKSNPATKGEGIQQRSSNNNGMRYRQAVGQDSDDVDFMYYDPGVIQTDGTAGLTSVSVQTDEKLLMPSSGHQHNRGQAELINGLYNLSGVTSDGHLPILNALLQELSCITGGQQITDTSRPRSMSGQSKATPRRPQTVSGRKQPATDTGLKKSETYKKQTHDQVPPSKRAQTSVIGLPRQRVRFKQTSLTYGMTRTQKMRLEINQKDKLPNRTRPCEVQRALAQKENAKRDSIQTPLSMGDLGMTYKIDMAKRQKGRKAQQHTVDVQVQTQQLSTEPDYEKSGFPGTTEIMNETTPKPDAEVIPSTVESSRSLKSQNSLEIFIPQVEGEQEEQSDQEKGWTTDQPPVGIYGNTGIIDAELDDKRGGSAMTMYTEDFEDSGTEDSQASYHLAFTRSNSADNENLKQKSNPDDSSASAHSQGSSKASGKPARSSRSPMKAKSRRSKAMIQGAVTVEQKIAKSEEDFETSAYQAKSSSGSSKDQKEESEESYSDDFQSVGSELQNRNSDATSHDSTDDNDQHAVLDLPPPAINLGYTY